MCVLLFNAVWGSPGSPGALTPFGASGGGARRAPRLTTQCECTISNGFALAYTVRPTLLSVRGKQNTKEIPVSLLVVLRGLRAVVS